jgi:hypothetical protein
VGGGGKGRRGAGRRRRRVGRKRRRVKRMKSLGLKVTRKRKRRWRRRRRRRRRRRLMEVGKVLVCKGGMGAGKIGRDRVDLA